MSVAIEEGESSEARSRCVGLLSILFPLGSLIVLLVGYATLGGLLFSYIEGTVRRPMDEEYKYFLLSLVKTARNSSENDSSPEQETLTKLHREMLNFKTVWIQSPERWTFFNSMFFCCTVFTTVGYGHMYPVTKVGKLVCILYAMVGIPLMLLVLTDVGDILAILVSKAYLRLHQLCPLPNLRSRLPWRRPEKQSGAQGSTLDFRQDMAVRAPVDIRRILQSQASVKKTSTVLSNAKIFDRIVAWENLARENAGKRRGSGALSRSLSCPDLNRTDSQRDLWDLCTGQELEKLDVPLLLILMLFFAYLLFGGLVLPLREDEINTFDAFYFCFVTLTTIGFGDIVPRHPKFFMLIFLFIIAGMAILSMAFKLGQSRFVSCYRECIRFLSWGKVQKYK